MKIDRSTLKGDIFGGLTAGIVALPLALAFGIQSGLGASAGLYGAIALGFFAALLGGTKTQISGPTGPMTVVVASVVALALEKHGSMDNAYSFILLSFVLSGVFLLVFSFLKIGKYIKYIPYPVLSGFMTGIGVIIISLQIFPSIGLPSPSKITQVFMDLPQALQHTNYAALAISLITVALIYLFKSLIKGIPSSLLALLVTTLGVYLLKIDVPLIGSIPEGLPELKINEMINGLSWENINLAIIPALTLAGLGAIDSLMTAVVSDNLTKSKHNSNKELFGQGIGNVVASLIGGIPGTGATMRTVVNIKSGGRTRLSGILHAIILLAILLGLGSFVSYIPLSVLAGVLITVGIGIVDKKGLTDLPHIPRTDAIIFIIVLILTVFVDLLQAVGIGMVIASVLFMKRASDLVESGHHIAPIKKEDREIPWEDEKDLTEQNLQQVYVVRLDGPIFFGAVSNFMQTFNNIPEHVKVVVIRMRKVPFIDQSGLYSIETVINDLQAKGIVVLLTIIQPQPMYMLRKVDLIPGLVPEEHVFETFEQAAHWLKEYFKK